MALRHEALEALESPGAVPPSGRPDGTGPLPGLSSLGSQLAAAAGQGYVTWLQTIQVTADYDLVLKAHGG